MRYTFKSKKIEKLFTTRKGAEQHPIQVVRGFFKVMNSIQAAKDERDLYALKSVHFEKLTGNREVQRSLRLNAQFRLIVEVDKDSEGKYIVICDIEDYHR